MENKINEVYVRQLIAVGETLIKNAESIAGTEKYVHGINVSIFLSPDEIPNINISKDILPERKEGLAHNMLKKEFNV